uniref:Uncharacterized protein n=1 Tax=Helianthus annuus TaxID=4232 RepID=A0A9K3HFW4_HELAN|nr:hypothetical protein HanXRQr2_Chr12g0537301 [Helianthus annuus]
MKPIPSSPQLLNCESAYLHCTCQPYLAESLVPNNFEERQVSASFLQAEIRQISSSHTASLGERSQSCRHPLFQ